MRAWLLAIAVALLGTQVLHFLGVIDLRSSFYRSSDLLWLGALIGGLSFGFGMTLTGGCSSRNLARLGGGNLKSLIVLLVMGISGYMTMNGLLALPRLQLEAVGGIAMADQGLLAWRVLGDGAWMLLALLIGGGLLAFCFADRKFRASGKDVTAGLVLGSLIPFGWLVTGLLGADPFEHQPLVSYSFVAPVGRGLIYLMTFPGATLSFGVAGVGGVILGAFLMARYRAEFRLEGFANLQDLGRHLIGSAMMGIGGVLGLGCTIGQGLTGVSTLALGSFLTLAAMLAGGVLGIRYLEQGSLRAALASLLPGPHAQRFGG